jgi:AraC-like DNA-binding protein
MERALAGADGLELEELCLGLLALDERLRTTSSAANRRHLQSVEDAKAVLLSRLDERLQVRAVARAIGASPFHLARLFRAYTGFSLHGYRKRMRLLRALDHLAEARGRLADLALDLGFSSQSHFTDAFRQAFGVPPSRVIPVEAGRR